MYTTRLASNEIFSPPNKIHGEVGQAKDLSVPRYTKCLKRQVRNAYKLFVVRGQWRTSNIPVP